MAERIINPAFERNDERGLFQEVLNDGSWESLIRGVMNTGAVLGNHYHKKTRIFFYLTRGAANIATLHVQTGKKEEFSLTAGQGTMLHVNESHAITFSKPTEFIMLKSHKYDPEEPDTFDYPVKE